MESPFYKVPNPMTDPFILADGGNFEEMLSIYCPQNYVFDQEQGKSYVWDRKSRSDFQSRRPITWQRFLHKAANTEEVIFPSNIRFLMMFFRSLVGVIRYGYVHFQVNYLGLLEPLHRKCSPCTYHYNAIVHMETFNRDSRSLMQCTTYYAGVSLYF